MKTIACPQCETVFYLPETVAAQASNFYECSLCNHGWEESLETKAANTPSSTPHGTPARPRGPNDDEVMPERKFVPDLPHAAREATEPDAQKLGPGRRGRSSASEASRETPRRGEETGPETAGGPLAQAFPFNPPHLHAYAEASVPSYGSGGEASERLEPPGTSPPNVSGAAGRASGETPKLKAKLKMPGEQQKKLELIEQQKFIQNYTKRFLRRKWMMWALVSIGLGTGSFHFRDDIVETYPFLHRYYHHLSIPVRAPTPQVRFEKLRIAPQLSPEGLILVVEVDLYRQADATRRTPWNGDLDQPQVFILATDESQTILGTYALSPQFSGLSGLSAEEQWTSNADSTKPQSYRGIVRNPPDNLAYVYVAELFEGELYAENVRARLPF